MIAVIIVAVIGTIVAIGVFNGIAKAPQSLVIANGTNLVPTGHYYYYSFQMTSSLDSNVVVNGTFSSSGGLIETFVLNQTSYAAFQSNSNPAYFSHYYDSGRVTSGTIIAHLPNGQGVYYLVLSNAGGGNDTVTTNASVYWLL